MAKSYQVSIPPEIREILGAVPGDFLEIEVIGIVPKAKSPERGKNENPHRALVQVPVHA